MIYITLGTQSTDFTRCMKMVESLINEYNIKEEVIAQVGYTKYMPNNIKCFDYVTENEFQRIVSEASVIISHAGSGALFSAIKKGKKVIAVARLGKYGEMLNDHQTELVKKLTEEGYILDGTYDLKSAWSKLPSFIPRKNDFHCDIERRIRDILVGWKIEKK